VNTKKKKDKKKKENKMPYHSINVKPGTGLINRWLIIYNSYNVEACLSVDYLLYLKPVNVQITVADRSERIPVSAEKYDEVIIIDDPNFPRNRVKSIGYTIFVSGTKEHVYHPDENTVICVVEDNMFLLGLSRIYGELPRRVSYVYMLNPYLLSCFYRGYQQTKNSPKVMMANPFHYPGAIQTYIEIGQRSKI
jgi:hypothetical protein